MKKFLKENWQFLIVGGVSIGVGAGVSIVVFSTLITWIMNALLWILGELVTRL